ncbi:polysaccharide biosynthesis C-terminal domain-containing protein [Micromonospora phytophila]|uniref:lipopolysaccharide biosynthesis protein n=1 Tax=Micromonospora phytophila TaxID=709888 RepID=UPI00202EB92D|nr:polysaccharide biosynthesis C-terminal domain-containing protein [Micromonospora phytophila]MCM0675383.1 polysaccharide biosynthesis C-terminal domain-containing protein [Micromonospora phytophila]
MAAAASLLINVLAARTLGPAGRGNVALLLQVGYLTNMLAMAGTDRAYPVMIPPQRGALAATGDAIRLVLPSGAIFLLASIPLVFTIGAGTSSGAGLTVVAFLVAALAMVAGGAVRTAAAASGVAGPFVAGAITGQLVLVVAVAGLAVLDVESPGLWLLAYGAALSLTPVIAWALLRRQPAGASPDSGHLRQARRLGLRLLPAGLAGMVMLRADRLLLPWLGSYEQLGLYIVVATVAEFAVWPVQSYVDAQAARWHRQHLTGTLRRARPMLAATAYGLAAGVALLGAGSLLVPPVFGDEYRGSVALLAPLAAGTLFYSVSRVAVGLGVATGRARSALVADIPAMVVALAAYVLLIPEWGALGAAVGSAVAYGVGAVLAVSTLTTSPQRPPIAVLPALPARQRYPR